MVTTAGSDDPSLAPVTYLFGGKTAGAAAPADPAEDAVASVAAPSEPAVEPVVQPAPALRRLPKFEDFYGDAAPGTEEVPEDDDEPPLTAEELASEREGEAVRAHNIALHALGRKGVSISEMTKLLTSRELDEDIVEAEIARLEAVGLLDDTALAENLVRSLQERKGLGRSGVTSELRRRGIDQVAISTALETDDDGDDEAARCLEIAVKRASQLSSYDTETAKRRLSGFLMRRGYSGQVVSAAVNAALEGQGSSRGSRGSGKGPRFR